MSATVLLVGNPTAQSGKAEARIQRALTRMREREWDVDFLATEPAGRTVLSLKQRLERGDVTKAVYMGGDGTFAEVAKGVLIAKADVVMGMLPSGTANDQGKSFGISADESALDANLDVIEAGWTINMDVGRASALESDGRVRESELFFDNVGWGMQPDILLDRNRDREIVRSVPLLRDVYRDQAVYAGAAVGRWLRSWLEPTFFAAEIGVDGAQYRFERLADLVINVTPVYAGEWVLDRLTDPDDGQLALTPFTSRRELLSKGLRDLKDIPVWQEHLDGVGVSHSKTLRGAHFELELFREGRAAVTAQVDGEEWTRGQRFRVECLPGRLPLICRRDWVPPWKVIR